MTREIGCQVSSVSEGGAYATSSLFGVGTLGNGMIGCGETFWRACYRMSEVVLYNVPLT